MPLNALLIMILIKMILVLVQITVPAYNISLLEVKAKELKMPVDDSVSLPGDKYLDLIEA